MVSIFLMCFLCNIVFNSSETTFSASDLNHIWKIKSHVEVEMLKKIVGLPKEGNL
jgi:hypothetical protein